MYYRPRDAKPPLPPALWDCTLCEAQAYMRVLTARVATLEATLQDVSAD